MRYVVSHRPAACTLDLVLDEAEEIVVQPGSMIAMDTGFDIQTSTGGAVATRGALGSLRSLAAGESLFRVSYRSKREGQFLSLAPDAPADVVDLSLGADEEIFVARGAWLASEPGVELSVVYGGMKGLMTRTGLFLLRARGPGLLFCVAQGAAVRRELAPDERVLIDNRYLVAFSSSVRYELVTVTKEMNRAVLSGEGLVNRYTGPGTVIWQTRAPRRPFGFATLLADMIF